MLERNALTVALLVGVGVLWAAVVTPPLRPLFEWFLRFAAGLSLLVWAAALGGTVEAFGGSSRPSGVLPTLPLGWVVTLTAFGVGGLVLQLRRWSRRAATQADFQRDGDST